MAENDDDQGFDEQDNDSRLVRDLRKQLKEASRELNELRPYRDQRVLQEAGFDPDSKQGKALLRLHDGDLTAEALRQTAEEYGFAAAEGTTEGTAETVDPVAQQRDEATQRIDTLRNNAQPVGSQKTGYEDYQKLQQANPLEATRLLQAGQVELPPHIAAVIESNRAERASQLGA